MFNANTLRGFAISALVLALTACQTATLRVAEPEVKPQISENFELAPKAVQLSPSIAELGYKDFFNDARLIQVIEMALANNRDLRIAALNVDKVQQQYQISENNQLPTIAANGGVVRQKTLASQKAMTSYNVGIGATSYEIDFWGRVRNLKDATLDSFFATQSAKDATQIALVSQVAQAWVNYSYAHAHLALAQQTLEAQQKTYDLNNKRFKAGISNEVSVRQSQMSVETARNDVATYKTQVLQAKNMLNLLVGQEVPNQLLSRTAIRQITSVKTLGTGLTSDLLNNRPDLKASEYQLSATGANIAAAKARLYPSIRLTSSAGLASTDLSNLFKSGAFIWSIAPTIDLPIFDWGTRQANIKISETEQKIALANYEKAIQTAFAEVNDVLATRAFIYDRLDAQRGFMEAAQVNYKLSTARFNAGIDSYLSVLDAQRSAYGAGQALLSLQRADVNNQIELYKSLGGGLKVYQTDEKTDQLSSQERFKQQQQAKETAKTEKTEKAASSTENTAQPTK